MKRTIVIVILLLIMFTFGLQAHACTLWAANGNIVQGGGSLIVKNRDWAPDHHQKLKLISPANGYKYIGLFVIDGNHKGLKAGINEKGLVTISASAGSIAFKERKILPYTHALYEQLLNECGSVDEAIARTELFLGPQYLMLADRNKVATIEIGPDGKYAVIMKDSQAIFHTNHYVDESMLEFNRVDGLSSNTRYKRIAALLSNAATPYNLDTFLDFSNDQNDGPDNSIFRIGSSPQKQRTMATWAVSIPPYGSPELYVKILNPGESEQIKKVKVEDIFDEKLEL
ncbi:hypothetical protein SRRS_27170 [Sporomusa rhizae]|uniref:carcinine hydrolase/isopenicillin-N N-acyltransferase family protein n=1 Tax=Sporomusa rhizae TaxID=357999 RepID=UPI00352BBD3A